MVNTWEVAILGAGYGGIRTAQKLDKLLGDNPAVKIRLINKNPNHILMTELHEVAGGRIEPEDVQVPLDELFSGTSVEVVQDTITEVDLKESKLKSESETYTFDYLVVACGSEPAFYGIPGMEEHSFTLWSLDDAVTIRNHVRNMFKKASLEPDPEKREAMLTFAVGGAGCTGVEIVGELAEWTEQLAEEYGIPPEEVRVVLIEALPEIIPGFEGKIVSKSVEYLEELGIEILTESPIQEVHPDQIVFDNKAIASNTLVWTGGVQANTFVREMDLELSDRGRIEVDEYGETSKKGVYAVGDVACARDRQGDELPPLVEPALQTGDCVAENITADIEGEEKEALKAKLHGNMVSFGARRAVADIMGIVMWGFLAVAVKHMVNIHYLFELKGLDLVRDYIHHQFGDVKGGIGLLIKHLTVKSGTYWLAFLRVFLGLRFFTEGLKKAADGWLASEQLVVSGATPMLWSDGTPGWYVTLMETFVVPHQVTFQRLFVIGEIMIGLMLIFGIFTVLAALGAIGMSANFIMSGLGEEGLWDPIWMLLIAIAMLAGAGKSFGLDYYLMPWLFNTSKYPVTFTKGSIKKKAEA